jgi:acyl carrier protein
MEIRDRVLNTFRSALEIEGEIDTNLLTYRNYAKWSSVAHMLLIAGLEEEFDTMLETDEILAMSSFDKAVDIMRKYATND